MKVQDRHDIANFLIDYPGMVTRPCRDNRILLRGTFTFCATPVAGSEICGAYELEIEVPASFPRGVPKVKELCQKIPRDGKHHVNHDDTLCLGSPLRLLKKIAECPTLPGFAEKCLVPFLYAVSKKLQGGGEFAFSELDHGEKGVVDDYMELFRLRSREEVLRALELAGMKRRIANKQPCPCQCGKRLGRCDFHHKLNQFQGLVPRSWFKVHRKNLGAWV